MADSFKHEQLKNNRQRHPSQESERAHKNGLDFDDMGDQHRWLCFGLGQKKSPKCYSEGVALVPFACVPYENWDQELVVPFAASEE